MKGDFTRDTFRPARRFTGVRLQQGRVQLDADWNEQADITAARIETETRDTIGAAGGPLDAPGFGIVIDETGDLQLTAGRYYVDGLLVENPTQVSLTGQPDLPGGAPLPEGRHLLYLDVFEQHVTFVEDPAIREVALGGPDTATRTRLVWQVRALPVDDAFTCLADNAAWNLLVAGSTGTMAARAEPVATNRDPCVVPASAGYRGLQNRLYRVEIHQGGSLGTATFKWSRDNGTLVLPIEELDVDGLNRIRLRSLGRDRELSLAVDQWVEILDDDDELTGAPGLLTRITAVDADDLILTLAHPVSGIDLARHPKVRRWDSAGDVDTEPRRWVALEDGIEVQFGAGSYQTGDHWLIPARTILGNPLLVDANGLDWPMTGDTPPAPQALGPAGVHHHYARLGIVRRTGTTVTLEDDCRDLFPPLTELRQLHYVSGEGQEVMPDLTQPATSVELAQPLRVGVSNGRWPVSGARVRFRLLGSDEDGELVMPDGELFTPSGMQEDAGATQTAQERTLVTGTDGLVACGWRLDGDRAQPVQQVEAVLLDVANAPVHLPVVFTANLSVAERVAYDPGDCGMLAPARHVQQAIALIASLVQLHYVGGDGQEAVAGEPLPAPLQVRVASACGPVAGAQVRFETLASEGGRVAATPGDLRGGGAFFVAITDADGVATAHWQLGDDGPASQSLTAAIDDRALRVGAFDGVVFHGQRSRATDEADRVMRVRRVSVGTNGPTLQNDTFVDVNLLARGLALECEPPPDPRAVVRKPVVVVTIEIPERIVGADPDAGPSPIVFRPTILDAEITVQGPAIRWTPIQDLASWLRGVVQGAARLERRVLVRLRVLGSFIWALDDPQRHLDGELFGAPAISQDQPVTTVRFPSGDGRRGGDLEMWFWLTIRQSPPGPTGVGPSGIGPSGIGPSGIGPSGIGPGGGVVTGPGGGGLVVRPGGGDFVVRPGGSIAQDPSAPGAAGPPASGSSGGRNKKRTKKP